MLTILEQYRKVLSGETTQRLFLEQVRKNKVCSQWITPLLTYDDTVRILKNKGVLTEAEEDYDIDDNGNLIDNDKVTSVNPVIKFADYHNAEKTPVEPEHFHGLGNDSGHDNHHMNEDKEGYEAALDDIKNQLKDLQHDKEGGPTATDINQLIVASKLEYGLDDRDLDALKKVVTEWWDAQFNKTFSSDGGLYEGLIREAIDQKDVDTVKTYLIKNGYNQEKTDKGIRDLSRGDEPTYRAFTSITVAPDFIKNAIQRIYVKGKRENILNEAKKVLTADLVNYEEYTKGWKYEFHCMPHDKQNWKKAQQIALANLAKNPNYYTLFLNGIDPNKKIKRTDLPVKVDKKNFVDKANGMKEVKGFGNAKASANKAKDEQIKPVKGVKEMTQKPKRAKGIKGIMTIPGKEKKIRLKETIENIVKELLAEGKKCSCGKHKDQKEHNEAKKNSKK